MSAELPRPSVDENISTTLAAGITDVATSFDVSDASKIVAPCYLVIDRVDASGTVKTSSLWEYIKVTDVTSNTLTVTRAQGGSSGQAHSSGAVVEAVITSTMFEDWYNALNPEHTASGGHVITTATVATLNVSGTMVGNQGQFVWTSPGALSTSLATAAASDHLPFLRASKNLTLTHIWAGLNSAPSTSAFQANVAYKANPTALPVDVTSTELTIDIGEYTSDTAATAAVLGLTSMASGTLLLPSIDKPGGAGDLTLVITATERE